MNNKPQPQQPQKCPRCESLNTKFCYYNNYSLSQPRYFCKACRRYWTQGGTLRNVRVGGGCRKAKRVKSSSSSSSSANSAPSLQPPQEAEVQKDPSAKSSPSAAAAATVEAVPSIYPFYQDAAGGDGGYLSSLAGIQSLNPSQSFNQMGSCSNLSPLSGLGVPSLGSQIRPSQQFYHMGFISDREEEPLCEAGQVLIQSSMANTGSASSHGDWTDSFIINNVNHKGSDASLWSTTVSTTSARGNSQSNNASAGGSFSLIPTHQWPDLPEDDPPP